MELQADLLEDFQNEITHNEASTGTRFADYLIDTIMFYVLSILVGLALSTLTQLDSKAMIYLVTYIVYVSYYTLLEGATQGKTIGKMVTGCKAIREDGTPITWNDAFMRNLSRIVPFEPFSAFGGHPWHDKWTNTTVVKISK